MDKVFLRYKIGVHKTQVSTFFITMMATFVLITFVTIMVGKTAKDATYSSMAADGAAVSAGAVGAYTFNYAAHVNAGQENKNFKDNWDEIHDVYNDR